MTISRNARLVSAGLGVMMLGSLALAGTGFNGADGGAARPLGKGGLEVPAATGADEQMPSGPGGQALVGYAVRQDVSQPLRNVRAESVKGTRHVDMEHSTALIQTGSDAKDPVVQTSERPGNAPLTIPAPGVNFAGVPNIGGWYPPDTSGDVGPTQFVQMTNDHMQVWDKAGNTLYGPVPDNAPFAGFGGICETSNDGDPVVNYDPIAGRWVLSQFAVPGGSQGYHQCFAVSTTGDATGSYYRYDFLISSSLFDDYPKVGVWPDAYYTSFNMFKGNRYSGPWAVAFDRAKMVAGQPATFQYFSLGSKIGTLLPADLDGATLPPAGSPGLFATYGTNSLALYKFHVDWTTPSRSTFTGPTTLATAAFTQLCGRTSSCVPQPGTSVGLDGLGDRLMHRLAYRNLGTYQSLVVNHSVDVGGGHAGVRWYEIRNPFGTASIYQQGSYAPDAANRWMGGIAMDKVGNIGLSYSVSSSSIYPSIRYTGRLVTDALGTLPQGEGTLIAGGGSQTGTANRWGDYSTMVVDPADDCTFWFSTEYMGSTSTNGWSTRIGNFKFPNCN